MKIELLCRSPRSEGSLSAFCGERDDDYADCVFAFDDLVLSAPLARKFRKKAKTLSQEIVQLGKRLPEFVVLNDILGQLDLNSPDGPRNRFNNPEPQSVLSGLNRKASSTKCGKSIVV